MPQYAFLGHLRINGRVTLSTHTHSFTWSRICVELSSAVFKICDQWSVDVSSILRSEFHCMQSVICRLQSVVCSLQSANVRHRLSGPSSPVGTPHSWYHILFSLPYTLNQTINNNFSLVNRILAAAHD